MRKYFLIIVISLLSCNVFSQVNRITEYTIPIDSDIVTITYNFLDEYKSGYNPITILITADTACSVTMNLLKSFVYKGKEIYKEIFLQDEAELEYSYINNGYIYVYKGKCQNASRLILEINPYTQSGICKQHAKLYIIAGYLEDNL